MSRVTVNGASILVICYSLTGRVQMLKTWYRPISSSGRESLSPFLGYQKSNDMMFIISPRRLYIQFHILPFFSPRVRTCSHFYRAPQCAILSLVNLAEMNLTRRMWRCFHARKAKLPREEGSGGKSH